MLCTSYNLFSQPIGKNEKQLNAGLGFSSIGIPVYVGFDYGYSNTITFGGEISFRSFRERYLGTTFRSNILGISANGNYHFNKLLELPSEFDVYGGANIGFYFFSSNDSYLGTRTSGLGLGLQIGGRYYLNNKMSINLELGGGNYMAGGKIGITYQL